MDAIRQCSSQLIVVFLDFRGRGTAITVSLPGGPSRPSNALARGSGAQVLGEVDGRSLRRPAEAQNRYLGVKQVKLSGCKVDGFPRLRRDGAAVVRPRRSSVVALPDPEP